MRHEGVELFEAPLVEQAFDALARGVLALVVLFLDARLAAGPVGLLAHVGEFEDLPLDGHEALHAWRRGIDAGQENLGGGAFGWPGGQNARW